MLLVLSSLYFCTPQPTMISDFHEAKYLPFLPLLGGHLPTIFAWWKEENLIFFFEMLLETH